MHNVRALQFEIEAGLMKEVSVNYKPDRQMKRTLLK